MQCQTLRGRPHLLKHGGGMAMLHCSKAENVVWKARTTPGIYTEGLQGQRPQYCKLH